jgi:hypothetical protein
MADIQIALRIKNIYFSLIFNYNDGVTSTDLKNTSEDILDNPLQNYYISYRRNRRSRRRKRKTKKRKCKFDEDESPDGAIFPVEIVGKEDVGFFFFPQQPRTTSSLLHQLMHLSCITRLLIAVGPPGFTRGG